MDRGGTRLEHLLSSFPELARQPEWRDTPDAPWLADGALQLTLLVSDLIEPFLERAVTAGDHDVVVRLLGFMDLLVVSQADIALVNKLRHGMAQVVPGVAAQIAFPRLRHLWVTDQPNILAPANLDRITAALAHGDVIFGFQAHFYGGSSPTWISWVDVSSFTANIARARPGDLFELWSLNDLLAKGLALVPVRDAGAGTSRPIDDAEHAAAAMQTYVTASGDEVVVVWRRGTGGAGASEGGFWDEWERVDEHVRDRVRDVIGRGGEVYAFRGRDLGFLDDDARRNILVKAKVPNERGEVPIGGAY